MPSDAAPLAGHGWAWLGAMVPSVPKLALGVGIAFRHVFKSLARARSQGAWQGHGPPGQCHRMPRPWPGMAGHGWAPWCQVFRSWPLGLAWPLDMFLRVWLEPDLKEPGRGMDLQANAIGCRALGRAWLGMAGRHGAKCSEVGPRGWHCL